MGNTNDSGFTPAWLSQQRANYDADTNALAQSYGLLLSNRLSNKTVTNMVWSSCIAGKDVAASIRNNVVLFVKYLYEVDHKEDDFLQSGSILGVVNIERRFGEQQGAELRFGHKSTKLYFYKGRKYVLAGSVGNREKGTTEHWEGLLNQLFEAFLRNEPPSDSSPIKGDTYPWLEAQRHYDGYLQMKAHPNFKDLYRDQGETAVSYVLRRVAMLVSPPKVEGESHERECEALAAAILGMKDELEFMVNVTKNLEP